MTTAFYSHPDCRGHDMGEGHPECPARLDAIDDFLIASGLDVALDRREAPLVALSDIDLAHESRFVSELHEVLERAQAEGLASQVEYVEDDYRNITGSYDAFVSVGMLEHFAKLADEAALVRQVDVAHHHGRCLAPLERGVEAAGDEKVVDGIEPPGALGMALAHVVAAAVGVAVEGRRHGICDLEFSSKVAG